MPVAMAACALLGYGWRQSSSLDHGDVDLYELSHVAQCGNTEQGGWRNLATKPACDR